jgi:hypothetical protein
MTTSTLKRLSAVLAAACLACGDLDVPDLNNPSLEVLLEHPTRTTVLAAATGLLISHRVDVAAPNGYIAMLGILGREAYNFDAADPRFIEEMLVSEQLDPSSPRFGGNFWIAPYASIRNANVLLAALEKLPVDPVLGLTAEEKESVRGFAKTIQALDFLVIINTRDTLAGPIDVGGPIDQLAPFVSKAEMFAHIASLLDQAKAHLVAGGGGFPHRLGDGFKGFDVPATFLKFNRGVKARVDAYREDYATALSDLSESFIDPAAPIDPTTDMRAVDLNLGVYITYGTGSGDALNGLVSPNLFVHPKIVEDEEKKPGGLDDDRVTRKTHLVAPRTVQGLTSDRAFSIYPSNTTPVPMIRNEELILLRAEANAKLGNIAAAADDINLIRVRSGGLAPRTDLSASNIDDELLKQRRYSLLFEGGHRWIDMRRFGRLNQLPLDLPTHHVHAYFPIPVSETDARK